MGPVDVDRLLRSLGTWGNWQLSQLFLIQIQHLAASFNLFAIVFLGYEPPFTCLPENGTYDGSNVTVFVQESCEVRDAVTNLTYPCSHGYSFDSNLPDSTIATEWDLVCNKEYQLQLTQTIFMVGQAFGAVLVTSLADRFGRKWVNIVSQLVVLVLAVGSAFSPNILVFSILRFPMGTFQQGIIMTGSVMPLELIPTENRAVSHLLGGTTWSICLVLVSLFGYVFRDHSWRHLQLGISSVSICVILHILFLDESLRWLIANGRKSEAVKLIQKAIRRNKVEMDESLQEYLDMPPEEYRKPSVHSIELFALQSKENKNPTETGDLIPSDEKQGADPTHLGTKTDGSLVYTSAVTPLTIALKHYTVMDVFKSKKLLMISFITCLGWIVNNLVYFGITLASSKLAGDRFVNFMLIAAVEFPSGIISYFTLKWLGRKPTIIIFDAIAGISLIVAVALKTVYGDGLGITALTILGKFGASSAFGALFIFTPELYPTNLRSFGLGMSSAASRIGGMVAPFSVMLMRLVPWAPGAIFGGLSLVVCGLVLFLPETRDKILPQTIEEIELWSKTEKQPHS